MAEDRNLIAGGTGSGNGEWWLPSEATEDRNSMGAGVPSGHQPVAVALRDRRDSQLVHAGESDVRSQAWRSPSQPAENRNFAAYARSDTETMWRPKSSS
ncbi:hypothetical protein GCM10027028_60480 [Streptomyces sundarbansensis]